MFLPGLITYSLFAGAASLAGTAIVFYFDSWAHKNSIFLISFGAGVMLAIAFLDLIPEASATCPNAWVMTFIGFLTFYVLQNIIMVHPCHDDECKTHLGVLSTVGFSIHSLLDGLIISIGFGAGTALGILTAMAIILHKLPDGITITGILVHAGAGRKKILLFSCLMALLTPLGSAAAYFFLRGLQKEYFGILTALTAGSFIYLSASDLLPESHKVRHNGNAVSFFSGVLLVALIGHFLHI
jgi:ZIP family zinc transporter/zinc and cadmium transporter